MPIMFRTNEEPWPSWIGSLDGQRTVVPMRSMYKPSLDDKDWPSWIGQIE
ncbi:MAG: hypothetical protein K9M03_04805 [Kiritimatiellales bacterium]|nr:hypothetical protein [Kiritimatiellales bacterium]